MSPLASAAAMPKGEMSTSLTWSVVNQLLAKNFSNQMSDAVVFLYPMVFHTKSCALLMPWSVLAISWLSLLSETTVMSLM